MIKKILFLAAFFPNFSNGASYHVYNKITSAHYVAHGSEGGVMTRMTGDLFFDENDFSSFKARITIDVNQIVATNPSTFPICLDHVKYPEIIFTSLSSKPVDSKNFVVAGTLEMNGITKPVEFDFTFDNIYHNVMPGHQTELDLYGATKSPIPLPEFGVACGEVSQLVIDQFNLYGLKN